jgi:hypothetical protein
LQQEEQLLGSELGRCTKLAQSQRGQYSPLSLVLTAQLFCAIKDISSPKGDLAFTGNSWTGLDIGQSMEFIFGDANRNQVHKQLKELFKYEC